MCFAETPIFFNKSRARTQGGANKAKSGAQRFPAETNFAGRVEGIFNESLSERA
jgi:hypothetical protein